MVRQRRQAIGENIRDRDGCFIRHSRRGIHRFRAEGWIKHRREQNSHLAKLRPNRYNTTVFGFIDTIRYWIANPMQLVYWLPVFLFSFALHEWGHAYVALRCGDPTARNLGRLTLNPFAHFDLMGFICLLFLRFGWGKPVPVNPRNFRDYKKGMLLVSVAGIGMNLMLALLGTAIFMLLLLINPALINNVAITSVFIYLVSANMVLFVFNLIPIPPLDGSKIVETLFARWIPQRVRVFMNRYGWYIIAGICLTGLFDYIYGFLYGAIWSVIDGLVKLVL